MTSTNTKVFVSTAAPATRDEAGYAAVSGYTEVNEITSIGGFGVSVDPVEVRTLSSGALQTYKGHKNYGGISGDMNYDSEDAGQNILRANILEPVSELTIKVVMPDLSEIYSSGSSFSGQRTPGSANNMVTSAFELRFNYPPVEVAPS